MKKQSGSLEKSKNFVKRENLTFQSFLKTIQDKDRKDDVKNKDLAIGVFAEDKALGVCQMEGRNVLIHPGMKQLIIILHTNGGIS